MQEHGTSDLYDKLEQSGNTYYIKLGDGGYDHANKTIIWNPSHILVTDNKVYLFPATILDHELQHAFNHENDPNFLNNIVQNSSEQYDNIEEEKVITGREQQTAIKHGETTTDKITRNNHRSGVIHIINIPDGKIAEYGRNNIVRQLNEFYNEIY